LLAFAPRLDTAILDAWRQRTGASIGFGIATFILVPIVAILFLVIVIALPLGLFPLLAIALLYTLGYTAATHLIGRLVMTSPRSRFGAFAIGRLILRVLALIPLVGGLVWVLAAALGLGLLFVGGKARGDHGNIGGVRFARKRGLRHPERAGLARRAAKSFCQSYDGMSSAVSTTTSMPGRSASLMSSNNLTTPGCGERSLSGALPFRR
jgi:hypothetical protein